MINIDTEAVRATLSSLLRQVNKPSDDESVKRWCEYVRTAVRLNHVYYFKRQTYMDMRSVMFTASGGANISDTRLPEAEVIYVELKDDGTPSALIVAADEGGVIKGVGLTVGLNELMDSFFAHVSNDDASYTLAYVRNVISLCDYILHQPTVRLCVPSIL